MRARVAQGRVGEVVKRDDETLEITPAGVGPLEGTVEPIRLDEERVFEFAYEGRPRTDYGCQFF